MSVFVCPVCGKKLQNEEKRYFCENNHSFDRASAGYVNLLLPRHGGNHGDDKLMVRARRDFLDRGYYEPLREAVCRTLEEKLPDGALVFDAGCGEGYYTAKMAQTIAEKNGVVFGADISKEALRIAHKRESSMELAVASLYHLPLADDSVDALTLIFSPLCPEEFLRVLKPGGLFVMAIPLREHLYGLKAAVYDNPYENEVKDTAIEGFELLGMEEIRRTLRLESTDDILNLFSMTPYYYKTSAADQEKLKNLQSLETKIAFGLLVYRKSGTDRQ